MRANNYRSCDSRKHGSVNPTLEQVRLVAALVSPVVPGAARRVRAMLGEADREATPDDLAWGRLEPGAPLGALQPLFPRVEREPSSTAEPTPRKEKRITVSDSKPSSPEGPASAPAPSAAQPAPQAAAPTPTAGAERIDIAEFARLDLRVAQVLAAEKVAGSKKLVKMQIDLGSEQRQIVAGIAEFYEPDTLVGRKVVVVANLKAAKLMGVESNGMVLAASPGGRAVLLGVDADVPAGTKVK